MRKLYDKIESIDKKYEFLLITVLSFLLVFGVVLGIGTLTCGLHMVDDHDFTGWFYRMKYENVRVTDLIISTVRGDLENRYEPLYFAARIFSCYLFGINMTAYSAMKALEIVAALIVLYYCGRLLGAGKLHALLFSLVSMVGYQSAIWWKLGPQEAQCTLLFALGFYSTLKYLDTDKKRWMSASLLFFVLMVNYKESYIILIPFVMAYVLYREVAAQEKLTLLKIWEGIKRRKGYLAALFLVFLIPVLIIVTYVGTHGYGSVGLDFSRPLSDYTESLTYSFERNLKWYKRFGILFCAILLTYWEDLKKLWKEICLTLIFLLPQLILFGKSEIYERYILPSAIGFAFFFVVVILKWKPLSGKRRVVYVLGILLLLAAHGRVVLREADYFRYRGESVTSMLEAVTEMAKEDTNVLACFHPNEEANMTLADWMRLHSVGNIYYYAEEAKTVSEACGFNIDYKNAVPAEQVFGDMDIVVMYNRDDRHFTDDITLDLSDFTEIPCGTLTMYVRNGSGLSVVRPQIGGLKIHF